MWALTGHEKKIVIAGMRMLRWISSHTRKDKILNERINENIKAMSIMEKLTTYWLRWYEHVHRRPMEAPIIRVRTCM